ncbi:MAG TPA: peptidyl-prolyl cis-trans isomerase [Thermoanaerobaculia bacterium]|jgi:parvulin-like peptidyl-prolyl isomerase|nr:peptidyl-prolyl cis-trans isomerase [Thermoanaerobaculia bacterium]
MKHREPLRALIFALPLLALLPASLAAQTLLIDRIVVRINDRIATMMDFEKQLAERRQGIASDPSLTDTQRQHALDEAGREVFTDIYQSLLLLSRADQLGARVTEVDVDKALATTRERMGLQTEEQMQQALQASGLTEEALHERLRENLLVQEVMGREVHPRLRVSEDELRRYYREHADEFTNPAAVRLQEVVVLQDEQNPDAVAALAKRMHDEIAAGKKPEDVVGKGTQLVDLGWVNRGDLDAELEKAAWALQPGGVTQPVRGRGGMHIVKLLERREPVVRPFDEVKDQISGKVEQSRLATEYPGYLRELEARSYIVLNVPPEAEGFKGLQAESQAPDALEGLRELSPTKAPAKPSAQRPATPPASQPAIAPPPAQPAATPPPPGR